MRRRALFVLSIFVLSGCAQFTAGPFQIEIRLRPAAATATPTPTPHSAPAGRATATLPPTATPSVAATDLAITTLTATGGGVNPRCGEDTRIDFTIENRSAQASAATIVGLIDSYNGIALTEAAVGLPPLAAGEVYRGSTVIVIRPPMNVVHVLTASIDPYFALYEIERWNNDKIISYNVDDIGRCDPAPTAVPTAGEPVGDFVIESLTISGTGINPRCGEPARIDFTVRNIGTGTTGPSTLEVTETDPSGGESRYSFGFLPLQPGEAYSSSLNIIVPRPPNVVHTLTAVINADGQSPESDRSNNSRVISYNVDEAGQCP